MLWQVWPTVMSHVKREVSVNHRLIGRRRRSHRSGLGLLWRGRRGWRGRRDAPRGLSVRASCGSPILRSRRFRRGGVQRVVRDYRRRRRRRGVVASERPEYRRRGAVVGNIMQRARYQPFDPVTNRIKHVTEQRERLRIVVVIFLWVLLIVVVVLRVRNCRQSKKKRSAKNYCNSPHAFNFA